MAISVVPTTMGSPASAQRTDDNAVEAADDAFGSTVGDSAIGIYSDSDVRGFSPTDAGNLRIEGLYYDQQGTLTDRTLSGSAIRVGISAQNYAFPAPTGIADYALRKPGGDAVASAGMTFGPRGSLFLDLDAALPIDGDRLGVTLGIGRDHDRRPYGGTAAIVTAGALVRYAPAPTSELIGFASYYRYRDGEAQPLIFSAGDYLPKRFARGRFLGQPWNDYATTAPTVGALGRVQALGLEWRLGLFRSVFDNGASTADLLFGTDREGRVANRVIVRERDDRAASTSGELRVTRQITEGRRQHVVIASLRGRDVGRRYGGAALVDFGPSFSDMPDVRPEPVTIDGFKTFDRIVQRNIGVAYQGKWAGVGELGLSIQNISYRKQVTSEDVAVVFPATRSRPWLPSATVALRLSDRVAVYGGYTRGLEESAVAPIEAVNRNEAPPAILTRQTDGGLRVSISSGVTAVAGLFRIVKPYFNLDAAGRFRGLGTVTSTGIEMSLAGRPAPGLSVVVGNVLLDARIAGEEVASGAIGKRPVASFARHTVASLDYRLPGLAGLSVDAVIDASSARTANPSNTLNVPGRVVTNVGVRYRFDVGDTALLLRGQIGNVTNTFGWNVGRSGYFTPLAARSYALSIVADI